MLIIRHAGCSDEETASFAAKLVAKYQEHVPLIRALESATWGDSALAPVATRVKLSGRLDAEHVRHLGARMAELMMLVSYAAERGANARRSLIMFRDRLEEEIRIKNRFKAKAGGSMAMIYMGMGLFFPLFSSISSLIISGAAGLSGSAGIQRPGFEGVCLLYVFLILCLSLMLAHPERRLLKNVWSALPYTFLASVVMLTTQTYLSGIL